MNYVGRRVGGAIAAAATIVVALYVTPSPREDLPPTVFSISSTLAARGICCAPLGAGSADLLRDALDSLVVGHALAAPRPSSTNFVQTGPGRWHCPERGLDTVSLATLLAFESQLLRPIVSAFFADAGVSDYYRSELQVICAWYVISCDYLSPHWLILILSS